VAAALLFASCAHQKLAGADLDQVQRPAFVSWIQNGAGPKSEVFRGDQAYQARLKKLDAQEADRRLAVKLKRGVTRFEVSDRLRAGTLLRLPKEPPWNNTIDASRVASLLGVLLVEEEPAPAPDIEELKTLGADAVVEFVISSFGMRSAKGKAGAFVEGEARMYFLKGGEIWRMPFKVDQVAQKTAALDPFEVAKDPNRVLFRDQLSAVLDQVSEAAAKELQPLRRRAAAAPPPAGEAPGEGQPPLPPPPPGQKPANDLPPDGELE